MPRLLPKLLAFLGSVLVGFLILNGATAQEDGSSEPETPVEESPLLVEPNTPEDLFRAVLLMQDLARPNLARRYLEKFLEADPDDALLLKLRDRHGAAAFLRLANEKNLRPLSTKLLERVNAAFRKHATDPARLDAAIALLDGPPEKRALALDDLKTAGPAAVARLLRHLGDPQQKSRATRLIHAMVQLGPVAVPPLLGALEAPDSDLRAAAIEVIGRVGSAEHAPFLWYAAFSDKEAAGVRMAARRALARLLYGSDVRIDRVSADGAAQELARTALRHFSGRFAWHAEADGTIPLWTWDDRQKTVRVTHVEPETASLFTARRLARQAFGLAPERRDLQVLLLATTLAWETFQTGWEKAVPTGPGTAHDLALSAGADVVADVLELSLEHGQVRSALPAIQVLAQVGNRHLLETSGGKKSSLLAALDYPDLRVQFAAANTVMVLDPEEPFRAARRVVEVLTRALVYDDAPQGLVIDPNIERAGRMASHLGTLGYGGLVAATGREGFQVATSRGDVELLLVHANTIRWPLSTTLANFRADARTAHVPIVVYGDETQRTAVERRLLGDPFSRFAVESQGSETLAVQVRPFLTSLKTPPLTASQRREMAETAAYWLAHIADGRRTDIFDLTPAEETLFEAVNRPHLARNALLALGAVATRTAQEKLAEVALREKADAVVRELAAIQLAFHIQRYGLLLSRETVVALHRARDRARQPELATALTAIIGSLKPDTQLVRQRLENFPELVRPVPPSPSRPRD